MGGPLEVNESHDGNQAPDVKTRGSGVEPAVGRHRVSSQHLVGPLGVLDEEPTPSQLLENVRTA
jgi:hypothetical protein